MKDTQKSKAELLAEIQDLRDRLGTSEEILRSIQEGEVDALIISTPQGKKTFTLQSADQSYRLLVEKMQQGSVVLSTEGLILYANKSFSKLLQQPLEKLIGSYFHHLLTPQNVTLFHELLQQSESGLQNPIEPFIINRGDVEIPVYLSISHLNLVNAPINCLVITDLTEQKRHEAVLASEKLARLILEQAGEAILVCDDTGQIIRASAIAEQLWGKKILGQSFDTLRPLYICNAHAYSPVHQNAALSNPKSSPNLEPTTPLKVPFSIASVLQGKNYRGLEVELTQQNGHNLSLVLNARLLTDQDNHLRGAVVILTDITQRKQVEEELWKSKASLEIRVAERTAVLCQINLELRKNEAALARSEQQLRLALEFSNIAIWDWNLITNKVLWNDQHFWLLGLIPEKSEENYQRWHDAVHPDDIEWVNQTVSHALTQHLDYEAEYRVIHPNGSLHWVIGKGRGIYNEAGDPIRMLGIVLDISDRKQKELDLQQAMEKAESANQAKSSFLANMSHELRTPLNVILGFTQVMARDRSLTPDQQNYLQTIRRSGDHLLSLINDVLDLSKIEAGHYTLEETAFDLSSLLYSLRRMLIERAAAKGLQLQLTIAPEVPQFIFTDEQKLRQVLLNLLSNAIKFTHQGSITLQAGIEQQSRDLAKQTSNPEQLPLMLRFEVTDTGGGIAPEELDIIFDAFVQAQAGKKSTAGTGLGLTISRKLLERMGGAISVRSTVGQGSTFTVTLPVHPTSGVNIPPKQHDRIVIGLAPGQPQHRILVVDDQPDNRLLMVRLLTQLGLEVREAANGQEAIELWQEWHPDLTWMDIRMPVLDGYAATQQIRALEKGQSSSSIIALTAQGSQSDRTLALNAGCTDYISKPFQEKTLFLKMAEHLGLEYLYAEPETSKPETLQAMSPNLAPVVSDLSWEELGQFLETLPQSWLGQLEDAALRGDDVSITELTAQLAPSLSPLANYFKKLVNKYQFEQIIQLIQSHSLP